MLNIHYLRRFTPLIGLAVLISWFSLAQAATDCAVQTEIDEVECNALIDLYNKTDGENWEYRRGYRNGSWQYTTDWNVTNTPCSWYGIGCDSGHVTEIFLHEINSVSGTIPDSLGNLGHLRKLYLSNSQLSGSIPDSFQNLSNLQVLHLSSNQLSGAIPDWLGNLNNLQDISLSSNQLTGSIPDSLGNLNNLQSLIVAYNQLSGSIPESLGNARNLLFIWLSDNQLSGLIPESLGNLSKLEMLMVGDNQLSGRIPESLGNLSDKFVTFEISNNKLCGELPLSFLNLSLLFYVDNNHLTASPAMADWLTFNAFGWGSQTPVSYPCPEDGIIIEEPNECLVYGVHDKGLNNSQLFTVNPETLEVNPLGKLYKRYDIEALDAHPQTDELYAASGDDTKHKGYLYKVDKSNGTLISIGPTGCDEVDALSFRPDGSLWGWAQDCGLLSIDVNTGQAEIVIRANPQFEIEDITWNTAGTIIYATESRNGSHHPDGKADKLSILWAYHFETGVNTICHGMTQSLPEIEALETLPNNDLLFGFHGAKNILSVGVLDVENCQLNAQDEVLSILTPYNDIEGIAWPAKACQ